jgi:uncharacterized membrane protein YcaP (DUF421 family)
MDSVFRALTIYVFLLLIFRVAGNRALAQITTFDFVLLLIIGAATRNALIGKDYSMIHAGLLIITLVGADALLSIWKENSPLVAKWVEGTPIILVENGEPLKEQMKRCRIGESEIEMNASPCNWSKWDITLQNCQLWYLKKRIAGDMRFSHGQFQERSFQ